MKLPTEIQKPSFDINKVSLLIYGAPKIGKSTFCSRFQDAIFMATEPGVNFIESYNVRVTTWLEALEMVAELQRGQHNFRTLVVDTADALWALVSEQVRRAKKAECLSDIPYGKGKDLAGTAFADLIAAMTRLGMGLAFISHAKMIEVSTPQGPQNKMMPTFPDRARDIILPLVDIMLFANSERVILRDGSASERRLLRTKATGYWEAGDRTGRLPDPIPLSFYEFEKHYLTDPNTQTPSPNGTY